MTSTSATIVVMLLYAAGLLPLGFAAWRGRLPVPAISGIAAAIAGLAFLQTGTLQRGTLASTDVTHLLAADSSLSRCEEMFEVLIEARVVLDAPNEDGMIVDGEQWDRLPPEIQEFVLACAQDAAGAAGDGEPIELIRR